MPGPTRRCPTCGASIPSKAYQCTACGTRLDNPGTKRAVTRARNRRWRTVALAAAVALVAAVALAVTLMAAT